MYTRAGATTSEVVKLVTERAKDSVSISRMCISLLRPVMHGQDSDGIRSDKKRLGGVWETVGGVQMEAVQIAGPEGALDYREV